MSIENNNDSEEKKNSVKGGVFTGILLITIGVGWLIFRFIDQPGLFPLFLGAGFLIIGCITRKGGLIIPGGIITGVGMGIVALEYNPFSVVNEAASGGVFLTVFSLGWFSITLLTRIFTGETEWWPLIPGGIMALIGGLILAGESGLKILELIGEYWPLSLVIAGIASLIGYFRKNNA